MDTLCRARTWVSGGADRREAGCQVPRLPAGFLRRERLESQLCAAVDRRLTVVTGVAGAGKSVLLAGWARGRGAGMTAWVGLRVGDNDRGQFWDRVVGALRGLDLDVGNRVFDGLSVGMSDLALAEALVDDVAAMGPAVVVLDNLHVLTEGAIIEAVAYLARNMPSHLHLVLASRQPPRFPLHRLRLSGDVVEISDADLRFSVEEALALFGLPGDKRVGADEVRAVVGRCEGWAAGLRLAALALPGEGGLAGWARDFAGDSELVDDYFWHEVLAQQPADTRQFLLATSVLDRLTAGACAEVTGRADAGQVLVSLAGENLFLSRWDGPEVGYRYHLLFRQFLRHRLALEAPMHDGDAHRRASAWFARNGEVGAAVSHLVAAGANEEAFALAAREVVNQVQAGFGCGQACLPAGLPDRFFEGDVFRVWVLATAMLCAGRVVEAAGWLRRLEQEAAGHPAAGWWRARVECLWAVHDALVGDGAGVLQHYRSAVHLLAAAGAGDGSPTGNGRGSGDGGVTGAGWWDTMDAALAGQLGILAARANLWLGTPDKARGALSGEWGGGDGPDDAARLGVLALVACAEGELREAYLLARQCLEEAEGHHRADGAATVDARLALGVVYWEQDDLPAAEHQLEVALGICESSPQRPTAEAVKHQLLRVLISQRRSDEALDRLRQLRQAELRRPLPVHLALELDQVEISCRLALGDLEGATRILKSMPPAGRSPVVAARLDLCAGRPDRAVGRLTAAPGRPLGAGAEVERLALLARAQLQLGNRRQADDAIRRAIDRGRAERHIRRVVEHAPELLPLLYEIAGRFPDMYVAELLAHTKRSGVTAVSTKPIPTLEPLTDREREILSHLTGHLTQHEIASGMYVSLNTLKTHIARVYRKLGAGTRSEAVALARAHGLL